MTTEPWPGDPRQAIENTLRSEIDRLRTEREVFERRYIEVQEENGRIRSEADRLLEELRAENAHLKHKLDTAIRWLRTLVEKVGEIKKLKELES